MKNTKIQWCDDTINPVMGCDGCELWPTRPQLVRKVKEVLGQMLDIENMPARVDEIARKSVDMAHKDFIRRVIRALIPHTKTNEAAIREIKKILKCYAGKTTENRQGTVKGYPSRFENPTLFPGRTEAASRCRDLSGQERPGKPWLDGFPRMIFVSDMGDALSRNISFEDLFEEIIVPASSEEGSRHIWLWLTKRPNRMATFGKWLLGHGGFWPKNLIPMTSITSTKTLGRIEHLLKVPSAARGLSVEPLFEAVKIPTEGIDWVIVGGESGASADPFDLDWARDIHQQCVSGGTYFFCKQLGANPVERGLKVDLRDSHGGDWAEWPEDLRVRQIPAKFRSLTGF